MKLYDVYLENDVNSRDNFLAIRNQKLEKMNIVGAIKWKFLAVYFPEAYHFALITTRDVYYKFSLKEKR